MRFANPLFLWTLLVIVPLIIFFMIWSWRVKQRLITQFVQSRLLAVLTVGISQTRQKLKLALLVAAILFLFIALARPQWGHSWEEAHRKGLDIVVAVDTSRSMLAKDVVPNRLTRAKMAALDLMKLAKNDRLALVSFAGTAFLQAPLTLDEEAFRQNLEALDVGIIPEGGTALGPAIDNALEAYEKDSDNHKILVIFTDGEDHDEDGQAVAAAKRAAEAGMRIFTIGVGTPQGDMLRAQDERGNTVYLKDEDGNAIKSHLNETLLQQIATEAHGFYLPLQGTAPMETLYTKGLAPLPKTDGASLLTKVYREQFHWPLTLAILCLIAEIFLSERKRADREKSTSASNMAEKTATLALFLALFLPQISMASSSSALKQFNAGDYEPSFQEYQRLVQKNTNDFRLHYNAGTAAYKAGNYESAQKYLTNALNSPAIASDLKAQQHAYYNLGNTQYRLGEAATGEPDKQQGLWEMALTNYNQSLQLDPKDTNASRNLQYVQKRLEELKKQQQQQDNQNNQDNKDKKDQKDKQDQQNQDQQGKDKDQQKQSQSQDQKKQDSKSSQQQKKEQEQEKQKQQQQQQAKKNKEDQDKKKQQASEADKKKSGDKAEQQAVAQAGKMTAQEAKKLLDEDQQNEKALIFTPPQETSKANNRSKHKDW